MQLEFDKTLSFLRRNQKIAVHAINVNIIATGAGLDFSFRRLTKNILYDINISYTRTYSLTNSIPDKIFIKYLAGNNLYANL